MIRLVCRFALGAWLVLLPLQADAQESRFASDVRRNAEHVRENCGELALKALVSCLYTFTTDYPFHVALGSIAPENGFALGLAFVERWTPNESWRIGWNADAVRSFGGSWRTGAYMKLVHVPDTPIVVQPGGTPAPSGGVLIREYPIFNVYAQAISLETQSFFGPGPDSNPDDRTIFSSRQTIVGASAIYPISARGWLASLGPSFVGAINGRWVSVEANTSGDAPPIESRFGEAEAPGLTDQPAFAQFEEGLRLRPSLANGVVRLNYFFGLQQFLAGEDSRSSFRRWTVDLNHEAGLYRLRVSPRTRDTNGPNECFTSLGSNSCEPISYSRNRTGTIGFRLLATSSTPFGDSRVPFYFQPTLGGSDVNGQRLLAGFEDYRFRGPKHIVLQESFEHSIWGPFGAYFMAEQGKVAERGSGLGFGDLTSSYSVGLTIRAGGMPMVNISYAWGDETRHFIATVDTSLLGGSARPSLF